MPGHASGRRRAAVAALVAATLIGGAAALGAPAGAAARPQRAPAAKTTRAAQVKQVKQAWTAFFRGTTPAKRKIALVQDGKAFSAVIKAQARSRLARSSSAKVTKVTLRSRTKATVVYTVLLGGQPVLKHRTGTALFLQHHWKVSASSFCALLALEQVKPAACAEHR